MANYAPIDYDALTDELLEHYLDPEYYQATKVPVKYVTDRVTATTLDEYVKLLCAGYINVDLCEELAEYNYIDALLENEWFHQWPLAHWAYIRRTMRRKSEAALKKKKQSEENIDCELEKLSSIAKEGWPNAIADLAAEYYCKKVPEDSGERYICMWIYASRKGYRVAGHYLYVETIHDEYERFCEELQLLILEEVISWYFEENNVTEDNYKKMLVNDSLRYANKLCKKRDNLREQVARKMRMRETAGRLFWPKGESPYEIKY